jgi:hypothetical protein
VKKIIILLMAVSIMLTSCGKSAGLLNRNKKADNKTSAIIKENPKQILNNKVQKVKDKNDLKQLSINFANEYKTAIGFFTVVAVIALGAFFVRKWIINKTPKTTEPPEITELPKKSEPSKILKSLPELPENFEFKHDIKVFTDPLLISEYYHSFTLNSFSVEDLIYIYLFSGTLSLWSRPIKNNLIERGYDVSTLYS